MKAIGILVHFAEKPPPPPTVLPLGQVALALRGHGLEVVFVDPAGLELQGERLWVHGVVAVQERWEKVRRSVAALYNRYPAAGRPGTFHRAADLLSQGGLVWGNGPRLAELCTDKLRSWQLLRASGLPCPELVEAPAEALRQLSEWGAFFAKPRFGSLGRGVFRLELRGTMLEVRPSPEVGGGQLLRLSQGQGRRFVESLVAKGPYLFQQAVPPPSPSLQGCSIRSLLQRTAGGEWEVVGRVARVSPDDPVANVSRGAAAWSLEELCRHLAPGQAGEALYRQLDAALARLDMQAVERLTAVEEPGRAFALELGLDYALSQDGQPFLLEANGKPLGRFSELARRGVKLEQHAHALLGPLVCLDAFSPPAVLERAFHESLLRQLSKMLQKQQTPETRPR